MQSSCRQMKRQSDKINMNFKMNFQSVPQQLLINGAQSLRSKSMDYYQDDFQKFTEQINNFTNKISFRLLQILDILVGTNIIAIQTLNSQEMYLRNLRKNKDQNQAIKQINQSKEFDKIQKQLERNEGSIKNEVQSRRNEENTNFYSIEDSQKTQRIAEQQHKRYSTNELTQAKTTSKLWNYNSGVDHSTQAASPHYKFETNQKTNQDAGSETEQHSIKKKLFYDEQSEHDSPQFNLKQSKYDNLVYTFKKKIDQYPRIFSERSKEDSPLTQGKINFARVNFSIDQKNEKTKQNDPWKLNFDIDSDPSSNIKKKLNFEQVSLKEENPILRQINEELKREKQALQQSQTDYIASRRNQTDMIKRKILQSKSDLKRFYEADSQNVQYEYRKAKFMDIFLGSKNLEHNFR